jgi:subtilisin family serine protease
MQTRLALGFGWVLMLPLLAGGVTMGSEEGPPAARVGEGRALDWVLVRFKPEARQRFSHLGQRETLNGLMGGLGLPEGSRLREPAVRARLSTTRSAASVSGASSPTPGSGFHYLDLPPGLGVDECLERLRGHPWLEYAEADGLVKLLLVPCDRDFSSQWWLHNGYGDLWPYEPRYEVTQGWPSIHAREAWDITTGSPEVIVGIVDTGIDGRLLELQGRVVPGWNVAEDNADTMDYHWHGTVVTCLVGANANNPHPERPWLCGWGGVGVDWQCKLMPVKVIDRNWSILASYVAEGIDYAVAHGCKIINLSWRLQNINNEGKETIIHAIDNAILNDVVVICPADNSGLPIQTYPAKYAPTIAVSGSKPSGGLTHSLGDFGSYGPELDLMAPGMGTWSTAPNGDDPAAGQRFEFGGSSAAAALVSGVAALVASVRPDLTHDQMKLLLCAGADDQGPRGYDIYTGWGQLNAYDSVLLAVARIERIEPLPDGRVQLSWKAPKDALAKSLFRVEYAPSLGAGWNDLPLEGLAQEAERLTWTGVVPEGPDAGGYFRLRIELAGF